MSEYYEDIKNLSAMDMLEILMAMSREFEEEIAMRKKFIGKIAADGSEKEFESLENTLDCDIKMMNSIHTFVKNYRTKENTNANQIFSRTYKPS